jgi:tetratricopeptide (TPR) repeat protein
MENKFEQHQQTIPKNWDNNVHELFLNGNPHKAIETIVDKINAVNNKKPKGLLEQLSYYLFLIKDYAGASHILQSAYGLYPEDDTLLLNLGISFSRNKSYKESIRYISQYLKKHSEEFTAWDSLAACYYHIGENKKAAKAGNNSLILKDRKFGKPDNNWQLPKHSINELTADKKKVISFSLWGNEKRYIFGALRNLLLAPDIYPDWELWFHVDNSVSQGFIELIKQLGGKVLLQPEGQVQRDKLCWRFNVANDASVGYFLVRDADSVFSIRECNAVQQWIDSGKHFHIIRDWWTHTDLILAGMWGGIAGVLPNIQELLDNYSPNSVTTPNIDQWFLRDCIWRYIKSSYLAHDRCFSYGNSQAIPGPTPEGNTHIGACEYHQRPEFQEKILAAWLEQGKGKSSS